MTRALVTGAGKRLGQAMAIYLAKRGYDVAVHYATSVSGAKETAGAVEAQGQLAGILRADLLDEQEMAALVPRAAESLGGPLTLLINNASIFEYDSLPSASAESWHRNLTSNLRAPFVLSQHFAEQVPEAGTDEAGEPVPSALIINMVDQRVRKLTPHFMSYTLAKTALWTLTQTSARALAPTIRVNAIGPGPTLQGEEQTPEQYAAQRANTILQRGANPEDICGALGYFLDASTVTGQLLCVDGGQHLAWQTPDVQTKG